MMANRRPRKDAVLALNEARARIAELEAVNTRLRSHNTEQHHRLAELEAERDKMTALFNARCREAKLEVAESRAIAFEASAKAIEAMPNASSEHDMDTIDRGHAAANIRALGERS